MRQILNAAHFGRTRIHRFQPGDVTGRKIRLASPGRQQQVRLITHDTKKCGEAEIVQAITHLGRKRHLVVAVRQAVRAALKVDMTCGIARIAINSKHGTVVHDEETDQDRQCPATRPWVR